MKISEKQLNQLVAIAKETTLAVYRDRLFGLLKIEERRHLIEQIESQQDETLVEISTLKG